jgi:hypothetical protein
LDFAVFEVLRGLLLVYLLLVCHGLKSRAPLCGTSVANRFRAVL